MRRLDLDLTRAERLRAAANHVRHAHGLGLLAPDGRLSAAALHHAERMRNLRFFAHEDPHDGRSMAQRLAAVRASPLQWAGENLAMCDDDAMRAVRLWLDSPGHRANLLEPRAILSGQAAVARDDGHVFWVQLYARPSRIPSGR